MNLIDFNNKIQEDLSWRKKEIIGLWSFIEEINNKDNELCNIQNRAFVLLVYSHLEWFLKLWWHFYLQHISELNKKFSELKYVFFDYHIKNKFKNNEKIHNLISFYDNIADISYKKHEINTKSNVNTEILMSLLHDRFWMDISLFEQEFKNKFKEKIDNFKDNIDFFRNSENEKLIINEDNIRDSYKVVLSTIDVHKSLNNVLNSLLYHRNSIAHWEKNCINLILLSLFKDLILLLLDILQEIFYYSIENEEYILK